MKIVFDNKTRTFSVAAGNVKGKLKAVYVNGQQVNVDGYGQFRTDGLKSISGKGKIDFNSMKCQKADFRGKTHFLGIECSKFEASGAINCSQIRASKVSVGCSGDIGSIVTSSASISNKPYSSSLPVIKGIASFMNNALGASGTLHIKTLTCNSATLEGDITIDTLNCKGKCVISGDNVKIMHRVQWQK
jgi:hypothetical protein